eukprot:1754506-Pleurochrysis_carterae.AAC.3
MAHGLCANINDQLTTRELREKNFQLAPDTYTTKNDIKQALERGKPCSKLTKNTAAVVTDQQQAAIDC